MLEGHGDDGWKYDRPFRADFSSNVLHGPLDMGLTAYLQERVATVTHYPEVDARTVAAAAAVAYGVSPEQVLVTNGATEAIYLVAQSKLGGSATIFTPSFAEYEDACRLHGLQVRLLDWEKVMEGEIFSTDLVFICNPNNPTGRALPLEKLEKMLRSNEGALVVVDESYIDFTFATSSMIPLLDRYPNVLVLRSLTKSYKIPGLRVGFAVGQERVIQQLRRLKMPWSVNRLALEAARYIFKHSNTAHVDLSVATARWQEELRLATGWKVHDTDTHYFLTEAPMGAARLKQWLVEQEGLLIRDASNFRGLGPQHFRVACQGVEENRLLTEALRRCTQTGL
ncbi:MAG: pyridoxal phosphate-dependent class II aminotransferase [Bacteroidetes bacterium]|nr:pyridoxal phosphate-dependent class II aminotransferase [Bacteroidota bacterium]